MKRKLFLRNGFTLIELLVVIGIMAIMLALFSFNLAASKAKIMDSKAIQEISQIGLAVNLYEMKLSHYPVLPIGAPGNKISDSSSGILSPYIKKLNGVAGPINYWWYVSADQKDFCVYAQMLSGRQDGGCYYFSNKSRGLTSKIGGQCDCPS